MSVAAEAKVDVDDLLRQADARIERNDWNAACEILAGAGSQARVREEHAFCLSRAKRYAEAIECLEELCTAHPGNARWQYMLGYQYYKQERYAEAMPHFVEASKLDPLHLRNLYRLAQTRLHLDEAEKAKRGAAEVLRLWHGLPPDRQAREARTVAKAAYLLGRGELKTEPAKAIAPLSLAVEKDPADLNKHYLLGKALRKAGRPEDAIPPLRHALRMKPRGTYVQLELAVALSRTPDGEVGTYPNSWARSSERPLNDWQALKGAGLAVRLENASRARGLLERAARKSFVRRSPAYAAVAEQLAGLSESAPSEVDAREDEGPMIGRIDKINPKRGFGFLTDQADQTRRYFKLPADLRLRRGQMVTYHPRSAEKGPAADVIGLRS